MKIWQVERVTHEGRGQVGLFLTYEGAVRAREAAMTLTASQEQYYSDYPKYRPLWVRQVFSNPFAQEDVMVETHPNDSDSGDEGHEGSGATYLEISQVEVKQ